MTAKPEPQWIIPLDGNHDGDRATVVVDARCDNDVLIELRIFEGLQGRSLSPLQACQLGMALIDAARLAGQRKAKQR